MKIEFSSQEVLDMICEGITKRTGLAKSKIKIAPETIPLTPITIEASQKDMEDARLQGAIHSR